MLSSDLKSKINWLWDRFWAGGLSNPITAIEQISYLLFMRRLEYVEGGKLFNKANSQLKWSYYTVELEPEKMLAHIKNKVFPFIKTKLNAPHEPFSLSMKNAVFLIDKASLLKDAVDTINEIYDEIEKQQKKGQHFQDTQGDLYEYLLDATNQAGKNGQFRTPRHIIQLMCEIINPNVNDKICDLTSGTAGFLVGAYQHILTKNSTEKKKVKDENGLLRSVAGDKLTSAQKKKLREQTFYGFDIDQTMVRIGLMNLIMHGITEPKIAHLDTLSNAYEDFEIDKQRSKKSSSKTLLSSKTKYKPDEQYDTILANPPFTGRIDKGGLSAKLGRIETSQSELLFLDRIIHMLKPNGKAAVIIPEGVLFGSGKAQNKTREILLKDCCLEAVISLPSGVFQPYTGVKTSILIFTKKQLYSDKYHTTKVWFYGMDSDGYSLDTHRKKLKDNPLPLVIKDWSERNKKAQSNKKLKHFYIPIKDIIANGLDLSYNQYKKYVQENEKYEQPKELLAQLIEFEKEILNDMNYLTGIL